MISAVWLNVRCCWHRWWYARRCRSTRKRCRTFCRRRARVTTSSTCATLRAWCAAYCSCPPSAWRSLTSSFVCGSMRSIEYLTTDSPRTKTGLFSPAILLYTRWRSILSLGVLDHCFFLIVLVSLLPPVTIYPFLIFLSLLFFFYLFHLPSLYSPLPLVQTWSLTQ